MTRSLVLTLGLAFAMTACGKKDEPVVTPTPTGGGPTTPTTPPPAPSTADRDRAIADSIARAEAARAAMVTEMGNRIHFDYDQFAIRADDQALLNRKAEILRANPAVRIRVVGHADDRGSDEYNLALGMRRATAAKDYLVRIGIEAGRIEVASLGEEVPLDPGANESAWAMNRRGEFEMIAGAQTLRAP
jgi:peptidoglycan-associated lipoprotein